MNEQENRNNEREKEFINTVNNANLELDRLEKELYSSLFSEEADSRFRRENEEKRRKEEEEKARAKQQEESAYREFMDQKGKIQRMIPSYGKPIEQNDSLTNRSEEEANRGYATNLENINRFLKMTEDEEYKKFWEEIIPDIKIHADSKNYDEYVSQILGIGNNLRLYPMHEKSRQNEQENTEYKNEIIIKQSKHCFRNGHVGLFVAQKPKKDVHKFKNRLSNIFNIDKHIELAVKKAQGTLLSTGAKIKTAGVNFAEGTVNNYNKGKSFVRRIGKEVKNRFKKCFSLFNLDKRIELVTNKVQGAVFSATAKIKTASVHFAEGTINTFNNVKSFVTRVHKNTKKKFNDYISDKKDVSKKVQSGTKLCNAMEEVYGTNKEKHLDYQIVNRTINIKEGVCQQINTAKTKIVEVSKKVVDKIKEPFDKLRNSAHDEVRREELQREIERIKEENRLKQEAMHKIKVRVPNNSGYVAMGALIILSTIITSAIIFIVIGNMLGR